MSSESIKTTTIEVTDMACDNCADTVQEALEGKDGVKNASVDLQTGRAEVKYDENIVNPDALQEAVTDSGYTVSGKK